MPPDKLPASADPMRDSRREILGQARLRKNVIAPGLPRSFELGARAVRGDRHNRHARGWKILTQSARHLDTVHARHRNVGDDDVRDTRGGGCQAFDAVPRANDIGPAVLQNQCE
jgi:hypothetical protein